MAAPGPTTDTSARSLRSAAIVGRGSERHLFRERLSSVRRGEPATVWIVGDAGSGKSRLIDDLVALARRHDMEVLHGRTSGLVTSRFGVIADAVRTWLRTGPVVPDLGAYAGGMRVVLPEWETESSSLDDEQVQRLAFAAVVELLARLGSTGPTLVVLDDLHWADPESLECVRQVVHAALPGVLLVAATRPPGDTALVQLSHTLERADGLDVVSLGPLSRSEVVELVGHLLGAEPSTPFVDEVIARTDGVPLLVEDVVDAHRRSGSVELVDGEMVWHGERRIVPATTAATVSARLETLDPTHRLVLVAAALVAAAAPDELAAITGTSIAAVDDAHRAGSALGLLDRDTARVAYRHALFADAVGRSARPAESEVIHRGTIELLRDATSDADLARRAQHRRSTGDVAGAVADLCAAAATSRTHHAPRRAEALARDAVALARGDEAHAARDELAAALAAQGRWGEALAVDSETEGEATVDRWLRMASCAIDGRHHDRLGELAANPPADLPDTMRPDVAVMRARLSFELSDLDTAIRDAESVLAARSAGEVSGAQVRAVEVLARAAEASGDRPTARRRWNEVAELARTADLATLEVRAQMHLAEHELFEGHRPEHMFDAVDVAARRGAVAEQTWAEFNLAMALAINGRAWDSLDVLDRAIQRARELQLDLLGFALLGRARVQELVGDPSAKHAFDEARTLLPDSLDAVLHVSGHQLWVAISLWDLDAAVTAARAATDAAFAHVSGIPTNGPYWLGVILAATGQTSEARQVIEQADTYPALQRWHSSPVVRAVALAIIEGDPDLVDHALASTEAEMPVEAAQLLALAATSVGAGKPHAARWLRTALDTYTAYPDNPLNDRLRSFLREAGGKVPRNRASNVPAELLPTGVTAREAGVLALLVDELSNADLASRLHVSVRTVESHVSSLLRKLQAESRAELAEIARGVEWAPPSRLAND